MLDRFSAVVDGGIKWPASEKAEKRNGGAVISGETNTMPHTYSDLTTHIVFSTKERRKLITGEIRSELFAYIGGLVKEQKGKPIRIGGVSDHVHMLVTLPPTLNVSDAMRFIKTNSSRWINRKFRHPFAWQKGYGAFSVSRSQVDKVANYVANQESHHSRFDYRNEFLTMVRNAKIEFDEQYLWK